MPTTAPTRVPGRNARPGRRQRAKTYSPFTSHDVECAPGTKPIYLYLRLSNYHGDNSDAIERQRVDLTRKLDREGGWTIMGEYIDNDSASKSAARTRRGWHQLNDAINAGRVTAVAFWKLDRLSRITAKGLEWMGRCTKLGCALVAYHEGEIAFSGMGKLLVTLHMAYAELETDVMSTRQLGSKAHAAEAGFNHGGSVPFGWMPGPPVVDEMGRTGRRLIPHPVEFPALKDAVEMVLRGESLNTVAQHWVDKYEITTSDGRPQYAASISKVLRSPRLVGYRMRNAPLDPKSDVNLMDYVARDEDGNPVISQKAVCDRFTWERLQRALRKNSTGTRSTWGSIPWLLNGVPVCPTCGNPLSGQTRVVKKKNGSRSTLAYYTCVANKRRGKGTCARGVAVSNTQLEQYVVEWLAFHLDSPQYKAALDEQAKLALVTVDTTELNEARATLAALSRLAGTPDYRSPAAAVQLLAMRTEQQELVNRLEERSAVELAKLPQVPEYITGGELRAKWDSMSLDEQRKFVRMHIERIDVLASRGEIGQRVAITPRQVASGI